MAVDPLLVPTIVCSWGGTGDTSYATLDEADNVATARLNNSAWIALNKDQKVAALISAARDIDGASEYIGYKYFYNQSLEFPRKLTEEIYASEPDSNWYDMITTSQYQMLMKRNLKVACIEQAMWLARLGGNDVHLENQARGIVSSSESYGSVSESYSYKGSTSSKLCIDARRLLKLYKSYPRLVRG